MAATSGRKSACAVRAPDGSCEPGPCRTMPAGPSLFVYTRNMDWASRRKFVIIASLIGIAVAILAVTIIAFVYETPTCSDGKQNADERGVDCGGACAYQCLADVALPTVRFVRTLSPQPGRYDVIAYIDNRNPSLAARDVEVSVELFDAGRTSLAVKKATLDIPAGATVPLYIPEAYRGDALVSQAFLTFDEESLQFYEPKKKHIVATVRSIETAHTEAPRIEATLVNPSAYTLYDIRPIATVFDGEGNAIAASQTFLSQLGGQGSAEVLFTWSQPFTSAPARVEVLPVTPLSP